MDELPSTEFRKTFARLKEQTLVTVNGHPIGTWCPGTLPPVDRVREFEAWIPNPALDDLRRKINRSK